MITSKPTHINAHDFYFCYNPKVIKYLRYERGIEFIVKAIHPTSKQTFCMFYKNDTLDQALEEYQTKSDQL